MSDLESFFQLSTDELWQALLANPRCLMNVKGAVAEEHLRLYVERLVQREVISGFTRGGEGKPDFYLNVRGTEVILECKNVRQAKSEVNRRGPVPIEIDFKKTRYQKTGGPELRFYRQDEFDIVAACLFNRTQEWSFSFAATKTFARHTQYPDRLTDRLIVAQSGVFLPNWTSDLESLLRTM